MEAPLSETPGLEAPPGASSNFAIYNPQNGILLGTVTICLILTTMFMIIRFVIRLRYDKKMKLEDCQYDSDCRVLQMLTI